MEKTVIQKGTRPLKVIASLFTIARTWKQPKCPSREEWKKKMWYIYTMEYCSATRKKKIMPFAATRMVLEMIKLNEMSQRKTNTVLPLIYRI